MFSEISKIEGNIILNERIRDLLKILMANYLIKDNYDYRNSSEAYDLCTNYNHIKVLVDTIFDTTLQNQDLLEKNFDNLCTKDKKNKIEVPHVENVNTSIQ